MADKTTFPSRSRVALTCNGVFGLYLICTHTGFMLSELSPILYHPLVTLFFAILPIVGLVEAIIAKRKNEKYSSAILGLSIIVTLILVVGLLVAWGMANATYQY